jgi:hypothetical protein
MRRILTVALLVFFMLGIALPAVADDVWVRGHTRSDGTYVEPHWRSAPDGNPFNNWSTQGNVNPYTGKQGTRDPYSGSNLGGGYGSGLGSGSSDYGLGGSGSGYGRSRRW